MKKPQNLAHMSFFNLISIKIYRDSRKNVLESQREYNKIMGQNIPSIKNRGFSRTARRRRGCLLVRTYSNLYNVFDVIFLYIMWF